MFFYKRKKKKLWVSEDINPKAKPEKLASPMLMPIFDKKAQWKKKPNNMKNVEKKKSNKIKTIRLEWQKDSP